MSLLSWLLPHRCPYCNTVITGQQTECDHCRAQFPDGVYVRSLSEGVCIAPFGYDGAVRESILRMKKDGLHTRANSFGRRIGQMVRSMGIAPDIVTSIPMYPPDQRQRGFNQAEQIARCTAKTGGWLYAEVLKKIRKNQVQHLLSAEQRHRNVQGVYAVGRSRLLQGRCILLIDDVCTTGSTLCECMRILKNNGAKTVMGAVAAMVGAENELHVMTLEQARKICAADSKKR